MDSPGPFTWPSQAKKFLPKKFLPKKKLCQTPEKNNFPTTWKKQFFNQREKFLLLYWKITNFLYEKLSYTCPEKNGQKKLLVITGKNDLPNKNFLILVWKGNFFYFHKKRKAFHFRSILNTTSLFFMLAKLNRDFNKLLKVVTKNISLYVIIMPRKRLKVNLHSIANWISRNPLLETGARSDV